MEIKAEQSHRSRVSSFIRQQTRGGRGEEQNLQWFLGGKMLRNLRLCSHGTGSKWFRSKNCDGWAFCSHGTC